MNEYKCDECSWLEYSNDVKKCIICQKRLCPLCRITLKGGYISCINKKCLETWLKYLRNQLKYEDTPEHLRNGMPSPDEACFKFIH